MVGAVGEMASMKRRKLWKTGEDGLCCSSSAIQTRLDPSSLLEERSETPIVFVCFFCVVGYLLWNRGGTVSRILCCMVAEVVLWTRHHLQISSVIPTRFCPWNGPFFQGSSRIFARYLVIPISSLFGIHSNAKLLLYFSPVLDQMAWKQNAAITSPVENVSKCLWVTSLR